MGSKSEDARQKMKDLKQEIQFDDPTCLLFTSVRLIGFPVMIIGQNLVSCLA